MTPNTLIDRDVRQLTYRYDMGDNWPHIVVVESVGPGKQDTKYPRFVVAERRCSPDDVGGLPGFDLFPEAMNNSAHEDHQQLCQWYGRPFDPDDIDKLTTKRAVASDRDPPTCRQGRPRKESRPPSTGGWWFELVAPAIQIWACNRGTR